MDLSEEFASGGAGRGASFLLRLLLGLFSLFLRRFLLLLRRRLQILDLSLQNGTVGAAHAQVL